MIKNNFKIFAIFFIVLSIFSFKSFAVSNDECAIWLCAPSGFSPSACSSPYDAMIKRVYHHKSPVPSLSSCLVSSSNSDTSLYSKNSSLLDSKSTTDDFSSKDGRVAFMYHDQNNVVYNTTCVHYTRHHHHDSEEIWHPKGCTSSGYYIQLFNNGSAINDMKPFSFSLSGRY